MPREHIACSEQCGDSIASADCTCVWSQPPFYRYSIEKVTNVGDADFIALDPNAFRHHHQAIDVGEGGKVPFN